MFIRRRQQRLEEEHANVEYQIRCLMLKPEANKTDLDKAKEEELINRYKISKINSMPVFSYITFQAGGNSGKT